MNKPITRVSLTKGGNIIKQGHDFKLEFNLYDSDGVLSDLTGGKINYKIARSVGGIVAEGAAEILGVGKASIYVTDNLGYGIMRVEFTLVKGGVTSKFPAENFINLEVTPSLDNLEYTKINLVTLEQFKDEIDASAKAAKEQADRAKVHADNIDNVMKNGPVQTVNGQTGAVTGLAKQSDLEITNTQLTETMNQTYDVNNVANTSLVPRKKRKPLMTFIDDDGRNHVLTKWLPIIQETGLKMTIPIVTGSVDNNNHGYMTWDEVDIMKNHGTEICDHTFSHPNLGTLTAEEAREEFAKSTKLLREHGLRDDLIVYPFGVHGDHIRPVVKEFYKAGVDIKEGINTSPIYTHALLRKTMGEEGSNTLDYYKEQLDLAIESNGWLIWKSHSQYTTMTPEQMAIIKEFIIYAQGKIDIVTLGEGLDIYGNIIDVGDYYLQGRGSTAPYYYVMDNEGRIHSNEEQKQLSIKYASDFGFDTPITSFPENMKSVHAILNVNRGDFPSTGFLETTRYSSTTETISHQVFYSASLHAPVYRRVWNTITKKWGELRLIAGGKAKIISVPQTVVPANGFATETIMEPSITTSHIVSGNPRIGLAGNVMFNIIVTRAGEFSIRYYNPTGTDRTLIERSWAFDIRN